MKGTMGFFSDLFRKSPDPREAVRPVWQAIIAEARQPFWYAEHGVEDSLTGRFDMVTAVTALMLIRMEKSPTLAAQTAFVTELFVEDMDGQLRESGVGDVVVGKHMGRLMSTLGGRIGALREALAGDAGSEAELMARFVQRNLTTRADADSADVAEGLRELAARIAAADDRALHTGDFQRRVKA